ncbi:hypothetical protein [Nitrosomonas sp.]|uniref:hypothetical protein n=1 Tax=Nitrosomonas sp. TaxID=42353 RepID=UPI00208A4D5C|nr:hypothetical protein [Nitrosomonas sp.]GJL73972.1 MAG: hypothetical protein NMNS02_00780 [Nitrosomonas sp.]
MKKTELAHGMGISRQMVYKLIKQGMPVDSLEAARAWRKRNIYLFMSKDGRIGGNSGMKRSYR